MAPWMDILPTKMFCALITEEGGSGDSILDVRLSVRSVLLKMFYLMLWWLMIEIRVTCRLLVCSTWFDEIRRWMY